jgi:hypothetical protein
VLVEVILYFLYFFRRMNSSQANGLPDEHATGEHRGERKPELHGDPKQRVVEMQGDGVIVGSQDPWS